MASIHALAGISFENWRILLEQSFIALIPWLTASSTLILRRRWQSLPQGVTVFMSGSPMIAHNWMLYECSILEQASLHAFVYIYVSRTLDTVNPRINAPGVYSYNRSERPAFIRDLAFIWDPAFIKSCCIGLLYKMCAVAYWLQQQTDFSTSPIKLVRIVY